MVPAEHYHEDVDEVGGRGSDPASRRNLTPWTKGDPRAIEAARKGGEARRRNAEARRLAGAEPIAVLDRIASTFDRDQLGPLAAAAAVHCIGEVVAGRQKVRDPAAWVRVLVDVARLEAGQVTDLRARVEVGADALAEAVALRNAARRAIAVEVDDVG